MIRKRKWVATFATLAIGAAGVMVGGPAIAKDAGSSPSDPIVVLDVAEVPEGAVEDAVSTYNTPQACDTTRSWVLTIPATEDTTHDEFRYKRVVPGQYHEAVTHDEYRYQRTVEDVTTEYHFSKFTQTKTRTYTPGSPAVYSDAIWAVWSPNNTHGPQDYVPNYPVDNPGGVARGTWRVLADRIPGGHAGPDGVYQQGGGNSSYFYRQNPALITEAVEGGWGPWSEFGPWTQWTPVTHESWETSTDPLGSPEFHGSGQDGNVQWYRQWQARFNGLTREVPGGSHIETSEGWRTTPPEGEGWHVIETRTVTDEAAYTDPDVTEYYVLGGAPSLNEADATWLLAEQAPEGWTQFDQRTINNEDGTPEVVTYYAYTDGAECEKPEGYEDTTSDEKCVDNDLVTTNSTVTGTPVQAEDGSWTLVETATSSQSIEQNAAECDDDNPPLPNPPKHHTNTTVPTLIDAGL